MKYFVYTISIVFSVLCSSCSDDEKATLEGKLVKNVWMQTKIEVYDSTSTLIAEINSPDDPTCGDFLRFQSQEKVSYLSECEDAGCGRWILDGTNLELIIAADKINPTLCRPDNFREIFFADDEIEITDNILISTGIGLGLRSLAIQPEYQQWKAKYEKGNVNFKCYFIPANPQIPNNVSCCADFNWD